MRKSRIVSLAMALAALVMMFTSTAATAAIRDRHEAPNTMSVAQLSGTEQRGCPPEMFCIYPQNAGWNNNHPSYEYSNLAPIGGHYWYNLKGQVGIHKVFNNMICAHVSLNLGYNGAQPYFYIYQGHSYDLDLTPYNSITVWDDPRADPATCNDWG